MHLIMKARFVHFKPWYTGSPNNMHTYCQILKIMCFLMQMEPLEQLIKKKKVILVMRLAIFQIKHFALSVGLDGW